MENPDTEEIAVEQVPPSAPIPPGARRRKSAGAVDASPTGADAAGFDLKVVEPAAPAQIFTSRVEHFAKLAEGGARALAAAEAAYRLAQQHQAVVDLYDPEQIDDDQLRTLTDENINRLYLTGVSLSNLVGQIGQIVQAELAIFRTIYPYRDGE